MSNPNTPVWTRERIEPSVEEAAAAGQKIMVVNGGGQTAIEGSAAPQLESTHRASNKPESLEPDPWMDKSESKPEPESKPQLSLREMLADRGVKGFCKPIPKVSEAEVAAEERKQIKPKTNIATMAIAEINDYLTDLILRAQLTPQLMQSNYELITDELGQIIAVKLSEIQIRERRCLRLASQSQSLGE